MRLSRSGIGLSLLFHALAFWGVTRAVWRTPQLPTPQALQATIIWLAPELAPAPPSTEVRPATTEPIGGAEDTSQAEVPAGRSERAVPPKSRLPSESAIPPALPETPSPPAERSSTPGQDLVEARRRAAVDVLEDGARADKRRSFAFPGTIGQQRAFDESERFRRREHGLQPPLTVFDSPAKGRAGLAEEPTVYGVHWIGDDCYVFHEPLDRFILPGLFVEPITCTRRHPRTDLFVTAKPSYLMGYEERAAVDAETQRRELLRRPTTGAVMPLAKD